jgi:formate hydrogenlyase subunit 3/multisubunit Na+/H+ antiporter MnhD subunit
MTAGSFLIGAAIAMPLLMLLACFSARWREAVPRFLWLAPIPALATAFLAIGSELALPIPFRTVLSLDLPGAMLLGVAALLWIVAGFYAPAWLKTKPWQGGFPVWWLLTLTGSVGVFVAADVASFYLFYSLVSLSAYGLVIQQGGPGEKRAGAIYVGFALLGEAFLLVGLVLLTSAAPDGSLLIRDAVAALPGSPWRDITFVLIVLGFGAKIGMVPLHVWMPLAYSAAPIPAVAVMSGAAVKAGVIGLIRFLPFDAAMPALGETIAWLGIASAFYGVAIGITQQNPKAVLAYSSISQMGVLAAVFGMGLATGNAHVPLDAAFYAAHHILVKGGLFLAIGVAATTTKNRGPILLLAAGILSLSLAGLPFTGGALAKYAVKDALGDGVIGKLAGLTAVTSALLMLHFMRRLMAIRPEAGTLPSARMTGGWLAIAVAAVLVPWFLYPWIGGDPLAVLSIGALAYAAWPILVGAALAGLLYVLRDRIPAVPVGDIVAIGARAVPAVRALGASIERGETFLREWPVAGVSLLTLVIALAALLLTVA